MGLSAYLSFASLTDVFFVAINKVIATFLLWTWRVFFDRIRCRGRRIEVENRHSHLRTSAAVRITLPRIATDAFLPYTCFVVTLALLFGGGGGYGWSDAVVQLAALPLLAWALFKLTPSQLGRGGQWAIVLLCAIIAWPLLQLIPMPPSLWSGLPGRGEIASAYEAAGMTLPWLPISLYPTATWLGLLSLLPATAVFLAMLSLERRSRRIVIVLIFIIIFASVVVGHATNNGRRGQPAPVLRSHQSRSSRWIFRQRKPQCRFSIFRNSIRYSVDDRSRARSSPKSRHWLGLAGAADSDDYHRGGCHPIASRHGAVICCRLIQSIARLAT